MEAKNWRVKPGEEPEPLDDEGKPIEKKRSRLMTLKEFFLKEYGHAPSRHHRRAHEARERRRNRRAIKAEWRKRKREARV